MSPHVGHRERARLPASVPASSRARVPSSDASSPPRAPLVPEPDKVAHARRERPRNTSGTAVPGRDATPPLTVAISDRERLRAMTTSSRGGREPSTARSRRPITRREHVARQRRCSSRGRRPRAGAGVASSSEAQRARGLLLRRGQSDRLVISFEPVARTLADVCGHAAAGSCREVNLRSDCFEGSGATAWRGVPRSVIRFFRSPSG